MQLQTDSESTVVVCWRSVSSDGQFGKISIRYENQNSQGAARC